MLGASKQIQVLANPSTAAGYFLSSIQGDALFSTQLAVSGDKTYALAYNTTTGANLAELAADGTVNSFKYYTHPSGTFATRDIDTDSSGNIVFGGYQGSNMVVVKLASDLSVIWSKQFVASGWQVNGCRFLSDGKIAVVGKRDNGSYDGIFVAVYNSDGTTYASKYYNDNSTARAHTIMDIAIDSSDNIYVTGNQSSSSPDEVFILKVDSSCNLSWIRYFHTNINYNSRGNSIEVDSSGNVYVTSELQYTYRPCITKFNSSGTHLWSREFSMTLESSANEYVVAVDPVTQQVYLGGGTNNSTDGSRALLIKAAATTGVISWARTFDVTGTYSEYAYDMKFTDSNKMNLVVYGGTGDNSTVFSLPTDGTLTDSWTVGSYTWTYEEATNYGAYNFTSASISPTVTTPNYFESSETATTLSDVTLTVGTNTTATVYNEAI